MKKINIIVISTLLMLAFSLVSCQKKWVDPSINQNPDAILDAPVATLLPAIEANMAFQLGGNDVPGITSIWMQYSFGSSNQGAIIGDYNIKNADVANIWLAMYTQGGMLETKILMEKSLNTEKYAPHYEGVAKILMAVYLGNAVDLWGDVPYSQAFQDIKNLQPQYDKAQGLYDTVQNLLTSSISYLAQTATLTDESLPENDYFFGGDASKWTKVAWALKARYALRLSNVNASWADNVINIIENNPQMSSNSDNMAFYFGNSPTSYNPIYMYEEQRTGYVSNNQDFFDKLAADSMYVGDTVYMGDPRSIVFVQTSSSAYAGTYYGSPTSPTIFMTYAEEMFIAAEAYQANENNAEAMNYLKKGITASIEQFKGVDAEYDAVADGWLEKKLASYDGKTLTKEDILLQKYVALYMLPEAYCDYRRTGIPDLTPYNSLGIPDRFPYSQDELNYNLNTPTTTIYNKLFWAK